jgi:tetratricopeptide (TPR) repeat protein/peroxiredoxin
LKTPKINGAFMKNFTFFLILTILFSFQNSNAQTASPKPSAVETLENLHSVRDYERGAEIGKALAKKFPADAQIQAWFVTNAAKSGDAKNAVALAEKLFARDQSEVWFLFALGNAYLSDAQYDKALKISEKLISRAPNDPIFIIFRANALAIAGKQYTQAIELLDEKAGLFDDESVRLTTKANVLYLQGEKEKSFAAFAEARRINPQNVNAFYLSGLYLNQQNRAAEALPILRRAVALSPRVLQIRRQFWTALSIGQPQKPDAERRAETVADINSYLRLVPTTAKVLNALAAQYRALEMPQKQKAAENALLARFPQTAESERILMDRLRRFDYHDKNRKIDETKRAEYVKRLQSFINRPRHFEKSYLGEVYNNLLFALQTNKNFSDAEYLKLANKAIAYEGLNFTDPYAVIAGGLLKRNLFSEAEKFTAAGLEQFEKKVAEAKKDKNYFDLTENFDRAVLLNALGESLLRQKKYEAAEKTLLKSLETSQKYNFGYKLLGELYEARGQLDEAEDAYISQIAFAPVDAPDYGKLKNLFARRTGGLDGFEKYLETVEQRQKVKRRAFIVADRDKEPKDLSAFNLKTFDGKTVSSADLKGKIIVVNVWTTWCGPCVKEMPELQTLYKKYENDSEVAVITINSEEDAATIQKFMTEKKYDFPVLLSGEYFSKNPVNVFPTTWFVDKGGKIVYTQIGYTKFLAEEFDWRIEELRK